MGQIRVLVPIVSCVFAAGLTFLDAHAGKMHKFFQKHSQARLKQVISLQQRSIASASVASAPAQEGSVARAGTTAPANTKEFPTAQDATSPLDSREQFKSCGQMQLSGARGFVMNQAEADAAFSIWANDCGLELNQLSENLQALWHYCDEGVVAACTTLSRTIKTRLSNQGLEEKSYPVRALQTLEAAEAKACEGGIISSCEFSTYYARVLESTAGFTTAPTVERVETALHSLCNQSHAGACGEIGLRLASAGRVEGNSAMASQGVDLLAKACTAGENTRCAQILHFEEEAGRDTVLTAARTGCQNGELSACIYLFEHPADDQDRRMSKRFLNKACRAAIPGEIDQKGRRACVAIGRSPGDQTVDETDTKQARQIQEEQIPSSQAEIAAERK